MKYKYLLLTVAMFIAGLVLAGSNMNRDKYVKDYQDKEKQASQGTKEEKSKFDKEWKEFKANAAVKIDANEKRIEQLKVKIKTASKEVKAKYDKEITALEQKNVELKKKINEYKYEGKDKWEEFKQGFNREMDIVGKAIKDFFSKKD